METKQHQLKSNIEKVNGVVTEVAQNLVDRASLKEADEVADAINKAALMVIQYGCSKILTEDYSLEDIMKEGNWLYS